MTVHIHRLQQSFHCVSAAAERSPVLEILSLHDSGFFKNQSVSKQLLLIHYILQSKQTDDKFFSKNTNKRHMLRPVTFFRPEV